MRKLTFPQFREQCQEMFSAFREHSLMHDLRVWDSYPGDILRERKCWYCCVRLTEEAQMMITYDPTDEEERPFVCWYDYKFGTTTYSHWAFNTLEEAMLFCCKEPHPNYRTYKRDQYILYRDAKYAHGGKGWQCFCNLSLLSVIDFIEKYKNDIPDGVWELRNMNQFRTPDEGITEYKIEIKSGRKCTAPFGWSTHWGFPDWIYESKIKAYYE